MSLFNIFQIAGSALEAQTVRLNTTASNLANVDSVAGSPEEAYKAKHPVFAAVMKEEMGASVQVQDIVESDAPAMMRHEPSHPLADENGYIYMSNVNSVEEMTNMISASRAYQSSVEILNTSKDLVMQTMRLGR